MDRDVFNKGMIRLRFRYGKFYPDRLEDRNILKYCILYFDRNGVVFTVEQYDTVLYEVGKYGWGLETLYEEEA